MNVENFRTLNLAVNFFQKAQSEKLPGVMRLQLLRAAQSIALNLAEGRGRATKKDQLRFFHIAFGSLRECQALLMLANFKEKPIWKEADNLAAHLYTLIKKAK